MAEDAATEHAEEQPHYYQRTPTQVVPVYIWSNSPAWMGIRYRNATGTDERLFVPPSDLYCACLTVIAPRDWQPAPAIGAISRIIPGAAAKPRGYRAFQLLTNDRAAVQALLAQDPTLISLPSPSPDLRSVEGA